MSLFLIWDWMCVFMKYFPFFCVCVCGIFVLFSFVLFGCFCWGGLHFPFFLFFVFCIVCACLFVCVCVGERDGEGSPNPSHDVTLLSSSWNFRSKGVLLHRDSDIEMGTAIQFQRIAQIIIFLYVYIRLRK